MPAQLCAIREIAQRHRFVKLDFQREDCTTIDPSIDRSFQGEGGDTRRDPRNENDHAALPSVSVSFRGWYRRLESIGTPTSNTKIHLPPSGGYIRKQLLRSEWRNGSHLGGRSRSFETIPRRTLNYRRIFLVVLVLNKYSNIWILIRYRVLQLFGSLLLTFPFVISILIFIAVYLCRFRFSFGETISGERFSRTCRSFLSFFFSFPFILYIDSKLVFSNLILHSIVFAQVARETNKTLRVSSF